MKKMQHTVVAAALALLMGTTRTWSADIDFTKDIQPIIENSCLKCHGPEKPKASLRLDSKEGLLKGSKGGPVVVAGKSDESTLYDAITAAKDDPSHMPAEGEPLTEQQTDTIRDWINQGLQWPDGLVLKAAIDPSAKPAAAVEPVNDPGLPITDAEKAALSKVQELHALAQRIAQNTNWLRVDFSLQARDIKDDDLALLKEMPNLIELDLGSTNITDAGLAHVKGLSNLTRLKLEKTKISDAGLENLTGLEKLVSLNLYGTEVTDKGIEQLKELKNLRKLYVWQTKVTEEGAKKLGEAIPGLAVDRGYDAVPVVEAKQEPAKPEEAKKDEAKKDEPKKEEAKKEEAKKDETKKDEVKKDEAKKDETKKDEAKKEEAKKDETKKDEAKKDEPKKEPAKQEDGKKESPKQDEAKQEQPKTEPAKPEPPKQDSTEKK